MSHFRKHLGSRAIIAMIGPVATIDVSVGPGDIERALHGQIDAETVVSIVGGGRTSAASDSQNSTNDANEIINKSEEEFERLTSAYNFKIAGNDTRRDAAIRLAPVLRRCATRRAEAFDISLSNQINIALDWFLLHLSSNRLPDLLVHPDHLPEQASTHPTRTRFALSDGTRERIDEVVSSGEFGDTLSDVVRWALCYYFSACAAKAVVVGITEAHHRVG